MARGRLSSFAMAQIAKRGLRGAGGFAKRGILGGAGRVTNALEMQRARNRQAERGMRRVGEAEYEDVNYRMIDRKEKIRFRKIMALEHKNFKNANKRELDIIKDNVKRVVAKNNLRIKIDPIVMDLLSINLLKKITELRKSGDFPKPPKDQKAMDKYITNSLSMLSGSKGKLAFVRGRNPSALTLEINSEIANTLNEVANFGQQ
ncbi:MAG: hypothetical protein HON47_01410 [Candidatus Diapherotrites archaeon]|jgi:hypothetical protein|uniref:Uncharacterized protein n=1 Tax=Candidatus Iainarchaeum sp. TaxID=3101447 RepID=A0A8T5GEF5_9ARCH|nr:hypothetical protein [Candidatus Diapherotrites archaeon]